MIAHIINISLLVNKISRYRFIYAPCWYKVEHFSSLKHCCSDQVINLIKKMKITTWLLQQCFNDEKGSTLHQHATYIRYFELRTVIFSAKFFTTYFLLIFKFVPSKTEKTLRFNFLAVIINQRLNEKRDCDEINNDKFRIYKEHGIKMKIYPKIINMSLKS